MTLKIMTSCGFFPILQYLLKLYEYSLAVSYLVESMRKYQEKNYIRSHKLEIRGGQTHKESFTVRGAFMCDVYGIVKVENI